MKLVWAACSTLSLLCCVSAMPISARPCQSEGSSRCTRFELEYRTLEVDGNKIFYREAGPAHAPTVVLLHGFPTSSFMFRDLLPALGARFHVIAPDYPGFGHSDFPDRHRFEYSFASLSRAMDRFVQAKGLGKYALYIQDYGAPIGLRLAVLHPERVSALIIQNGNAYDEGLSGAWDPLKAYWRDPTSENRQKLRAWLTEDGTRLQYLAGVPETLLSRFSPDTWELDWSRLNRPGNIEMQLDLFRDYRTNVELYPKFQEFFRSHRPPTLIVWGRYDPFFTVDGAKSYLRDLPDAELHFFDTGHFALETHGDAIAGLAMDFLLRTVPH